MSDEDYASLFKQPPKSSPSGAWEDVAREFQVLGNNLGAAVRAAWERQETAGRVTELQDSLQSMIDGVNRAIAESTSTPEAQEAREQLVRVTESVRLAAERTTREVRRLAGLSDPDE